MIRDMNLVREILLAMESRSRKEASPRLQIAGHSDEETCYHVRLMSEAGLIVAKVADAGLEVAAFPIRLTWAGHEFLDAAREPARWSAATKTIREKAGAVGFEVLKELLIAIAKKAVGVP